MMIVAMEHLLPEVSLNTEIHTHCTINSVIMTRYDTQLSPYYWTSVLSQILKEFQFGLASFPGSAPLPLPYTAAKFNICEILSTSEILLKFGYTKLITHIRVY